MFLFLTFKVKQSETVFIQIVVRSTIYLYNIKIIIKFLYMLVQLNKNGKIFIRAINLKCSNFENKIISSTI